MERITEKMLESLCKHINKITNSPEASYTKRDDGHYTANPGNYHLSGAYGGWNMERMCNEGGGVSQPIGGGYHTKRELYEKMTAFIRGIEEGKALK